MTSLFRDTGNLIYIIPQQEFEDNLSPIQQQQDQKRIIILSATEQFSKTERAKVTSFPVSTGAIASDHYRADPIEISFRGVISPNLVNSISFLNSLNQTTVQDYVVNVKNLLRMPLQNISSSDGSGTIQSRRSPLMTIYLPDGNGERNCVITSFKITRDNKVSDGYNVDITAKKLLLTDVNLNVVPASDTTTVEEQTTTSTGVNETLPDQVAQELTILDPTEAAKGVVEVKQ